MSVSIRMSFTLSERRVCLLGTSIPPPLFWPPDSHAWPFIMLPVSLWTWRLTDGVQLQKAIQFTDDGSVRAHTSSVVWMLAPFLQQCSGRRAAHLPSWSRRNLYRFASSLRATKQEKVVLCQIKNNFILSHKSYPVPILTDVYNFSTDDY